MTFVCIRIVFPFTEDNRVKEIELNTFNDDSHLEDEATENAKNMTKNNMNPSNGVIKSRKSKVSLKSVFPFTIQPLLLWNDHPMNYRLYCKHQLTIFKVRGQTKNDSLSYIHYNVIIYV